MPSLALIVLDGWGLAPPGPGNAISQAATPVFDELWERYPHTTLSASGRDVGLPEGQMGNSEVGHLNLGAGSVVKQDLTRIDDAIADGSFFENPVLKAACEAARSGPAGPAAPDGAGLRRRGPLGLGAHRGVHRAGRSTRACPTWSCTRSPTGGTRCRRRAPATSQELERWLRHAGRIGTVSGRYYAMDRDRRWDRTKLAYDAIVHARGPAGPERGGSRRESYRRGETDEFVRPTVIGDYDGVADGDAVLHFNFRPDRARQLVRALGEPDFDEFPAGRPPSCTLTTHDRVPRGMGVPGRVSAADARRRRWPR